MHSANAARRKDADTCPVGEVHRRTHGSRPTVLERKRDGKIASADFHHRMRRGECFEFGRRESDTDAPIDDGDGFWFDVMGPCDSFKFARSRQILRIGQAMRDNGGFQGE